MGLLGAPMVDGRRRHQADAGVAVVGCREFFRWYNPGTLRLPRARALLLRSGCMRFSLQARSAGRAEHSDCACHTIPTIRYVEEACTRSLSRSTLTRIFDGRSTGLWGGNISIFRDVGK